MNRYLIAALGFAIVAGCATRSPPPLLKDNELSMPADYKSWPKFLVDIQRADAKQIRDIYVNPVGAKATAAGGFPNGTVFVMENYAAKARADGSLETGADGKLVKGNLLRVYLMGKEQGWGASAPANLKNGDWIYAAYLADGKIAPDPIATCRACHLPLTTKDYVHRYDEYFQKRSAQSTRTERLADTLRKSDLRTGAVLKTGDEQVLALAHR